MIAVAAAVLRPRTGAVVAWLCLISSFVSRVCGVLRVTPPDGELAPAAAERASWCPQAEFVDEEGCQQWELRHRADLDSLKELCKSGPLDVLLLGDSITEGWHRSIVWKKLKFTEEGNIFQDSRDLQTTFGPQRRVGVAAIIGDRTTDLLWRLRAGGLGEAVKQCAPRTMHVLVGTHDLRWGAAPVEVGESNRQLVDELITLRPDARLTLQLIMPRGSGGHARSVSYLKWAKCPGVGDNQPAEGPDLDPQNCAVLFQPVSEVNRMIARMATEIRASGHDVGSLDCNSFFLNGKDQIARSEFPDMVHPNGRGRAFLSECYQSVYHRHSHPLAPRPPAP